MNKFFSVFMALTVSVGLSFSSYAQPQKPYEQPGSLGNIPKYKEDSVIHATDFDHADLKEVPFPGLPQVEPTGADDGLPLLPDIRPMIIDRAPDVLEWTSLDTRRPTRIPLEAKRLSYANFQNAPGFWDDS